MTDERLCMPKSQTLLLMVDSDHKFSVYTLQMFRFVMRKRKKVCPAKGKNSSALQAIFAENDKTRKGHDD